MTTPELIQELRHPANDFPSYFTDLCARAADALGGRRRTPPTEKAVITQERALAAVLWDGTNTPDQT